MVREDTVWSAEALPWAMEEQGLMVNYLCGTVQPFVPAELPVLQDEQYSLTTWSGFEDKYKSCLYTVVTWVL